VAPEYLSVSQLNTYLMCPRKYRFRYIDRLQPERRSIDLALGTAVHYTIGWWMEQRMAGEVPTEDAVQAIYKADWPEGKTRYTSKVKETPDTSERELIRLVL
jgi:hypothetical protein